MMSFFQADKSQDQAAAVPGHVGADSLKKTHHIATLWFGDFVNDHAK